MASHLPSAELEARLRAFYDTHNPGNQQNIAEIVKKYHGKEAALCAKLRKKYGVAPALDVVAVAENPTPTPTAGRAPAYDPHCQLFRAARPRADPAALDFGGAAFDALRALRARALAPPVGGIAPLDNIHKCRHLLPETDPQYQRLAPLAAKKAPPKDKSSSARASVGSEQQATPLLFEALADTYLEGPFTLLRRCFLERRRVGVVVRRVNSVRGTLRGFLKAFDKHMNLVLLDVEQHWIPPLHYAAHDRAKRLARDAGDAADVPVWSVADERRNRGVATSSYAKQLFVRGDNIVMVVLDDKPTRHATTNRDYTPVTTQRR